MEKFRSLNNFCGVDVGGTNIKMTAVLGDCPVQKTVPSGPNRTKQELIEVISSFYQSFDCDFEGLGIAFTGITTDGLQVKMSSKQSLKGLCVSDFEHLHCKKVRLINDANATALAGAVEYPDSKVLIGITCGTGLGCGIVINGRLFTGANGLAGEIHGNPAILTSNGVIKNGRICSGSQIWGKIHSGEEDVNQEKIIKEASCYFGMQIVSFVHLLNPDVIYLSGGGFLFPGYVESIREFVYKHAEQFMTKNLKIVRTNYETYSGCIGAMRYLLTD